MLRASDFPDHLGQENNPDWKTLAIDEITGEIVVPRGSIGFRWGQKEEGDLGKWNLDAKDERGADVRLRLSPIDSRDAVLAVAFHSFGSRHHAYFQGTDNDEVMVTDLPVEQDRAKQGET